MILRLILYLFFLSTFFYLLSFSSLSPSWNFILLNPSSSLTFPSLPFDVYNCSPPMLIFPFISSPPIFPCFLTFHLFFFALLYFLSLSRGDTLQSLEEFPKICTIRAVWYPAGTVLRVRSLNDGSLL